MEVKSPVIELKLQHFESNLVCNGVKASSCSVDRGSGRIVMSRPALASFLAKALPSVKVHSANVFMHVYCKTAQLRREVWTMIRPKHQALLANCPHGPYSFSHRQNLFE